MRLNICKSRGFALRQFCIMVSTTGDAHKIQKCVLALIFANAFEITKFAKLMLLQSDRSILRSLLQALPACIIQKYNGHLTEKILCTLSLP